MRKLFIPLLVCLLAAGAASAQPGGGRGRGGGGPPPSAPKKRPVTPEFIGVVKSIDAATGRLTISYDPVEVINWPAGTQPFPVAKSAMLEGVTVGEKVRFTLDSGEIATLKPF
ncbi:copper-binding protein [Phenylobacterium sp.]|uniref:copper-binding protein n=1 Tax=Phenylobacterium sp. TaxID=1871053 RepID=UPI002C46F1F8|nr:copper-binding protein [Phenylobacterium sp.]HLZ76900.1 copper-binding protein [Phenylobacterium sp.]